MTIRPEDEKNVVRFSWDEMDALHREVADRIRESGFEPEVIVGIARCGQVPATHLSYLLGVRRLASISVRTMPSDAPLETGRVPAEVSIHIPSGYLDGRRVLLVDAVMESGTTAELCLDELRRRGASRIAVAMMVDWYNSSYKIASGVRPSIDYVGTRATCWPDFPWEH
jgi:hypoxanthine phosphoribosyltransferase